MKERKKTKEIPYLASILKTASYDFSAKYMAVCDLSHMVQTHPQVMGSESITALLQTLKNPAISDQTQSYFLFREAAKALCAVIVGHATGERLVEQTCAGLIDVLATTAGDAQRATAEALGSLPFSIDGPRIKNRVGEESPEVEWHDILKAVGGSPTDGLRFMGRSLVTNAKGDNRLLVVKFANPEGPVDPIYREGAWIEHLSKEDYSFPVRFNIPLVLKVKDSYVFRLKSIPTSPPEGQNLHPERYAFAFTVHKDYFAYPNYRGTERRLSGDEFKEVMCRNAWLFGKLTSLGMVHAAPIPLFHNRVQGPRREDNGLYEWQRAGRLDRWLDSCSYPNFGLGGVRDFEHLLPFKGPSKDLYPHIGTQLLGLSLVVGSYFRNKDRSRVGFDSRGEPVDARDLFDRSLFKALIQGIFERYYHGFVGREFTGRLPFDFEKLTARMIEEMGVDRHMEEILRAVDQNEMTDPEFVEFLVTRGRSQREVKGLNKGAEDIVIHTGPHLGGFNQGISIPEFIEAVGSMSALCMFGRYWQKKCPSISPPI